jgi:hypothetical protein
MRAPSLAIPQPSISRKRGDGALACCSRPIDRVGEDLLEFIIELPKLCGEVLERVSGPQRSMLVDMVTRRAQGLEGVIEGVEERAIEVLFYDLVWRLVGHGSGSISGDMHQV